MKQWRVLPDGSFCPIGLYDSRYLRLNKALDESSGDTRTPTERDKARMQYSLYLQRLSGVTQVVTPDEYSGDLHSRQTHSAKVALVAGEIAKDLVRRAKGDSDLRNRLLTLGGIDIGACEAAGLAHDIGHPPFGHVAEKMLDEFLRSKGPFASKDDSVWNPSIGSVHHSLGPEEAAAVDDGFEGNAQSLRTVVLLDSNNAERDDDPGLNPTGLNLTAVTLAAILKYPWWRVPEIQKFDSKFGAYSTELSAYDHARAWTLETEVGRYNQTVEAAIMDLADDLTYAVHDLQDFYIAGRLDLNRIKTELVGQRKLMLDRSYFDFAKSPAEARESYRRSEEREATRERNSFETAYRSLSVYYSDILDRESYINGLEEAAALLDRLDEKFEHSTRGIGKTIKNFSNILSAAIPAVLVSEVPPWKDGPYVSIPSREWHMIQVLKYISKSFIIRTEFVGFTQRAQSAALERVLLGFDNWLRSEPRVDELPEPLRSFLVQHEGGASKVTYDQRFSRKAIVDHLCAKTDRQVMELSKWFLGTEMPRFVSG